MVEMVLFDADWKVVTTIDLLGDFPDIVRWEGRYFYYNSNGGQYVETTPVDVKSKDFKAIAEKHFK